LVQTEANITIDSVISETNDTFLINNGSHPDKLANFFESIHNLVSNDAEMENFIHNDKNF